MSLLAMTGASQQNKDPAVTSRTKSPMKKRKKNQPQSQQQQQNPHPPPQKKQRVMSKILHERPEHFVGDESSRLSARYMEKFAKLIETQPPGFQRLLEKMLRAMFLRRPINIYVFFADFLEAELDRRTLAEIQFGCICYEVKREPTVEGPPPPPGPPPPLSVCPQLSLPKVERVPSAPPPPPPPEEKIAPPPVERAESPPPFFAPEPEPEAKPEPEPVKEISYHDMFIAEPEEQEPDTLSPEPAVDEPEPEEQEPDTRSPEPVVDEPEMEQRDTRQSTDSISYSPHVDQPETTVPPEPEKKPEEEPEEVPEEEPEKEEEEVIHIESEHADCRAPGQFSRPDFPPKDDDPGYYDPDFEDVEEEDDDEDCETGRGGEHPGDQATVAVFDIPKGDEGDQGGEPAGDSHPLEESTDESHMERKASHESHREGESTDESHMEGKASHESHREGETTDESHMERKASHEGHEEVELVGKASESDVPKVTIQFEDDSTTEKEHEHEEEPTGEGHGLENEVTLADHETTGDEIFMTGAETEQETTQEETTSEKVEVAEEVPEFSPEEPITMHDLLAPAHHADDGETPDHTEKTTEEHGEVPLTIQQIIEAGPEATFEDATPGAEGGTTEAEEGATEPKGGATEAEGGATEAEGGATEAEGVVTETEGGATEAEKGAAEAEGGVTESERGVTEPEGGATEDEGGATEADGGATEAEGGATEPERGATEAEGGATEAEVGAKEAEVEATEAEGGANEAEVGATEADVGAKEAEGEATEAEGGANEAEVGATETANPEGDSEPTNPFQNEESRLINELRTPGAILINEEESQEKEKIASNEELSPSSDLSELKRDQSIVHPDSSIFRVFEDGYTVRSMAPSDAVTVQEWQSKIGFPPQPDLEILLELHPPGSRGLYVGEFEGQAVASLIQVRWSENVLYATAFYVEDKFRRRGFGSRLLNVVAREHAGNGIVVLDSVGGWVAEIYQSWGYKEAFKTEWVRGVAKAAYNVEEFDGKLQFSKEVDFEEILRYDSKCLVSRDFPTRRDFLRKLIDVPRGSTIVAVTGSGSVVGFGCRRPCIREGYHIVGPLYAEDGTIAEAILAKLCSEVAGNYINMDICVPNNAAVVVAKHFELEHMQYFHRMHLNGDPHEFKVEVFAVTSTDSCGF